MALAISMTNPSLVSHSKSLPQSNVVPQMSLLKPVVALKASPKPCTKTRLLDTWREIQGSDDWKGLIDPLTPLLRSEIVRYGELVVTCYKAFDLDPCSNLFLNCKYGKRTMLELTGTTNSGYDVTKYVYATPDIAVPTVPDACTSRWVGYVAVSSDKSEFGRRDILVAFRGTVTISEWIANFMSSLTPARLNPNDPRPDIKVESGFLSLYTSTDRTRKFSEGSCREQLLNEIARIVSKYKGEEVSITLAGHSMGSSLALLLGYDIAELGLNRPISGRKKIPITVYSFGGPRVGNSGFKKRCEELGVKVLRVANVNDPVTKMPGVFLNENIRVWAGRYEMPWSCSCYAHVGVELALDFFKMENPSCVHDLEAYIGLLRCSKVARVGKIRWIPKLDRFPWENAARQVGNLVQSLGFGTTLIL